MERRLHLNSNPHSFVGRVLSISIAEFTRILKQFTVAVETGNGAALASLFSEEGRYEDCFYGMFTGRSMIKLMLEEYFWRHAHHFEWSMIDPVVANSVGYSSYRFSYRSRLPGAEEKFVQFDGMAKFEFDGKYISRYSEIFNTGMALVQLGFNANRIHRHLKKKVG